ncbi:sugar ABC transporter substrate-binding protein [Bacillus sp. JJ1566]|uniref:ABC transporter substrate-binding protein n=1 Tax=Bacillus sp. JJ1566 TaxID=3122961 RepID=UPI002FFF6D8C
MKKRMQILSILLIAMLVLAACGSGTETDSDGNSSAGKKVEVTLWSYFSPDESSGKTLVEMIEEFNSNSETTNVKVEFIPHGDYSQQVSIAVAGKSLPDIMMIDNPEHAQFASMGVLADLTDKIKEWGQEESYKEGPWASTIYDGKNYGIPFTSNALALYYNKDLFEQANIEKVPETWEELEAAAAKLTQGNTYGFALAGTSGPEGVFHFMPFLMSAGSNFDDLENPEASKAMEFLTGLIDKGYMSKEVVNWGQGDVKTQFVSGNVAMMVNGPWFLPDLTQNSPDLNFGVALLPKDKEFSSVLGGENLAITAGSDEEEAWEFLKWISEFEQNEKLTVSAGQFSPRKDVSEQNSHWKDDEFLSVFDEGVSVAKPRGPHPDWNKIAEAIQSNVHKSFTGVLDPKEATKQAAKEVNEIIK